MSKMFRKKFNVLIFRDFNLIIRTFHQACGYNEWMSMKPEYFSSSAESHFRSSSLSAGNTHAAKTWIMTLEIFCIQKKENLKWN